MTNFVLTINPPLDIPGLYECHDVLFNFVHCPAKRSTHSIKLNRRERLEVKDDRPIPDEVCQVMNMRGKMDINVMTSLQVRFLSGMKC